jgi:hypothetical protein
MELDPAVLGNAAEAATCGAMQLELPALPTAVHNVPAVAESAKAREGDAGQHAAQRPHQTAAAPERQDLGRVQPQDEQRGGHEQGNQEVRGPRKAERYPGAALQLCPGQVGQQEEGRGHQAVEEKANDEARIESDELEARGDGRL